MITHLILSLALIAAIQAVPNVPEPKNEPDWLAKHEDFVNNTRAKRDEINVLFYGGSITEGWKYWGKPVYDQEYEPLGTANYGIGGDSTEHVLWRIINGEVEGLHPKVIVLKIGTNNGGDSQDDIVKGITAIVEQLRTRMPAAKILLLGILPRSDGDPMWWYPRINDINIKIARLDDNVNVHFLDMFNQFSVSWGQVDRTLFDADLLHLVQAGYQKWADTMRKLFNELLKV